MKKEKFSEEQVRAALVDWGTPRTVANRLQTSIPTATRYIEKYIRLLETKDLREAVRGRCSTAYKLKDYHVGG